MGDERVRVKFIGVTVEPPAQLRLTYEKQGDGGEWKRRQRRIPLRGFTDKSDLDKVLFSLQQRHPQLKNLASVTVIKLLRVAQEMMKGLTKEEAVKKVDSEFSINPNEDLNTLMDKELDQRKKIMQEDFLRKIIQPGDKDFVWEKEEHFDQGQKILSEWDDDEIKSDMVKNYNLGSKEETRIKIAKNETEGATGDHSSLPEKEKDSLPEEEKEDEEAEMLDEKLLLSICDFNVELPFTTSDSHEKPPTFEKQDEIDADAEEAVRRSYLVIDIGTSILEDEGGAKDDFIEEVEDPFIDPSKISIAELVENPKKTQEKIPQDIGLGGNGDKGDMDDDEYDHFWGL